MYRFFILAVVLASLTGCKGKKAERFQALPFPEVIVPEMLQEPQDRMDYMAEHWWDRFADVDRKSRCDSAFVNGVSKAEVEQKFANWTRVLSMVDFRVAEKSIKGLYSKVYACEKKDTSSNVFEQMSEIVERYLYDPNSPMRNEDHYAVYADCLANSDFVEPLMREKFAREVKLASLNRTGTKAADFRFTDSKGRMYTLYGIEAKLTLLFFSNPGCTACKEIIDVLDKDPIISELIQNGTMAVLNIYIDEDIQDWLSYMPIYPKNWYNGFDPEHILRTNSIYNVRAIPSLYLLDEQKKVIMKDPPQEYVFEWLVNYVRH